MRDIVGDIERAIANTFSFPEPTYKPKLPDLNAPEERLEIERDNLTRWKVFLESEIGKMKARLNGLKGKYDIDTAAEMGLTVGNSELKSEKDRVAYVANRLEDSKADIIVLQSEIGMFEGQKSAIEQAYWQVHNELEKRGNKWGS